MAQLVALLAQPTRLSPARARMVEEVTEPAMAELVMGSYSGFLPSRPPCCTMVGGSGVINTGQDSSETSVCNDWIMSVKIFS